MMKKPHDLGIKIFIDALLNLTHSRISRLREFYDEGERHFNIENKDLEDRTAHLTQEEWDWGEEDLSIELRHEMEELRELKRNFSIVGLFTVLEMFLQRALLWLHWQGSAVPKGIRKELRDEIKKKFAKKNFDEMKPAFKEISVLIAEDNNDWQAILGMKLVRNCITHHGGRVDEEMAEKLKKDYKICVIDAEFPTRRMKLPENYFRDSADLVERTCDRIAKQCYMQANYDLARERPQAGGRVNYVNALVELVRIA